MSDRSIPLRSRPLRPVSDIRHTDIAAIIASLGDDIAPGMLRLEALFDRIEVRS